MLNPNSQGKIYQLYHEEKSLFDKWLARILLAIGFCFVSIAVSVSAIYFIEDTYTLSDCGIRKVTTHSWGHYIQIQANADLCLLSLVK